MIYYLDHEIIDSSQGSCLSLGCAGKFIAFIELLFYSFIFFSVKDYLSGKWQWHSDSWILLKHFFFSGEIEKLYILGTVLGILSVFSVSLFVGVINQTRMLISPWLWLKYAVISLQVLRFISVIITLAGSEKNPLGASPIFELLLLGKWFPFD